MIMSMSNENTGDKGMRRAKIKILPEGGSDSMCQMLLAIWQDLAAGEHCQLSRKL